MDRLELQKLRDLPIEGVAERLALRVTRHKCLCPFHGDHHPSLSFNLRRNTFRCFVCGAAGGTIDLVMRHLQLDFIDACRWLANAHHIIVDQYRPATDTLAYRPPLFEAARYARFFERPWLSEAARRFLFGERRLDPRVVTWCRLTSWRDKQGVDWLQIPYYDLEGRLIGMQNRHLPSIAPSSHEAADIPRFRFPRGSRYGIYNLPVLRRLRRTEPLYIAEGCSDCWALLSAGHKAIAIPSATLLKPTDVEMLSALRVRLATTFHMYPDQDAPGEHLFCQLRALLAAAAEKDRSGQTTREAESEHPAREDKSGQPSNALLVYHQLPVGCKDFSEYYLKMKNDESLTYAARSNHVF